MSGPHRLKSTRPGTSPSGPACSRFFRSLGSLVATTLVTLSSAVERAEADASVLFRDDFETLDHWEQVFFPNIPRHSEYAIEASTDPSTASRGSVLRLESDDSASALVSSVVFNPAEFPILRWRWRTETVFADLDPDQRAGDDYPLRLYVAFGRTRSERGLFDSLKRRTLSAIYGRELPDSTLIYVWSGRERKSRCSTSPFTSHAGVVSLESTPGGWREEEVNLLADYRACFSDRPPGRARLGIMNDSDNSHRSTVSFIDYVEVASRPAGEEN